MLRRRNSFTLAEASYEVGWLKCKTVSELVAQPTLTANGVIGNYELRARVAERAYYRNVRNSISGISTRNIYPRKAEATSARLRRKMGK